MECTCLIVKISINYAMLIIISLKIMKFAVLLYTATPKGDELLLRKKSETELTASVLKKDPKHTRD